MLKSYYRHNKPLAASTFLTRDYVMVEKPKVENLRDHDFDDFFDLGLGCDCVCVLLLCFWFCVFLLEYELDLRFDIMSDRWIVWVDIILYRIESLTS